MKRTKLLLSVLASFLLAFVMVFAAACDSNTGNGGNGNNNGDYGITDSSKDGLSLDHISLSGYTETFELGDAFSTGNLVVTATLIDYNTSDSAVEEETLNASQYTVDSSEYNANRVGTYTIFVSHTRSGVTRTAHYKVDVTPVKPAYGGIVVKLAEGESATYTLTTENPSATVSKDILAVYEVGADGEVSTTPLAANAYGADLYLGSKKIENNTTNEGGVYSLVAYLVADSTKKDYIPVYVVNPVTKIELANAETAKTEQDASSKDELSGTWEFTVTYSNGFTKTVKAGDAGLTIGIDTRVAGENKTANVKYVEVDASGASHEVTTTVTYTIKAKEQTGSVDYKVTYDVDSDDNTTGKWTTTWANGVEDSEGTITFNASALDGYKSGSKTSEDGTYSAEHAFEFKSNKNLIITVGNTASNVTINYFISHGTANDSTRTASVTKGGETVASITPVATDVAPGLYKMTVENATAGTYTLTANNTMRVYYVEITYTIEGSNGGGSTTPSAPITVDIATFAGTDEKYADNVQIMSFSSNKLEMYSNEGTAIEALCTDNKMVFGTANSTKVIKTGGALNSAGRAIVVTVTGAAKIEIVATTGTDGTERFLSLNSGTYNAESGWKFTAIGDNQSVGNSSKSSGKTTATFNVDGAGTYYIGSTDGGISIYSIVITYGA